MIQQIRRFYGQPLTRVEIPPGPNEVKIPFAGQGGFILDLAQIPAHSHVSFYFEYMQGPEIFERLLRIPIILTNTSQPGIVVMYTDLRCNAVLGPARPGVDVGYELRTWDGGETFATVNLEIPK